jgi:methylated-DNA-[protein]-cysteine S-methyltransferase
MAMNFFKTMNSPVGVLTLIASNNGLSAVLWEEDCMDRVGVKAEVNDLNNQILIQTEIEILEYFEGKRRIFSIPLDLRGTDFQLKVWSELKKIPYGKTISYLELAKRIGNDKASRAVGGANGKNPVSIIVPCHRVIGSNGKLTGFAGGVDIKEKLLNFENSTY